MSEKTRKTAKDKDKILQAFEETKGEQMNLLDGFEEESQTPDNTVYPDTYEDKEEFEAEIGVKYYTGHDGVHYSEEEWHSPVVRNGPTRKEVEGWKSRHEHVYFTPFDGATFVWRTLNRPEYREIIRDTTLTALDREELFTERCVLFPYDFSLEKIKKSRAGIASLLSEMIMDKSGFVAQSAPIKL